MSYSSTEAMVGHLRSQAGAALLHDPSASHTLTANPTSTYPGSHVYVALLVYTVLLVVTVPLVMSSGIPQSTSLKRKGKGCVMFIALVTVYCTHCVVVCTLVSSVGECTLLGVARLWTHSPEQFGVVPDQPLVVHVLTCAPVSTNPSSQEYTATHL